MVNIIRSFLPWASVMLPLRRGVCAFILSMDKDFFGST